jgi:hypothetical protein
MTAHQFFKETCETISTATYGSMFGCECYKCGTKPFVFFDKRSLDAAAFKLIGDIQHEALALDGAQIFDPSGSGRVMNNWIQLPFSQQKHWAKYALVAFEQVLAQPEKPSKKTKK